MMTKNPIRHPDGSLCMLPKRCGFDGYLCNNYPRSTKDREPTRTRSGEALERLMAVISERTTIEPRHRPVIRASLRAYRRAIESEASEQPAPPIDVEQLSDNDLTMLKAAIVREEQCRYAEARDD